MRDLVLLADAALGAAVALLAFVWRESGSADREVSRGSAEPSSAAWRVQRVVKAMGLLALSGATVAYGLLHAAVETRCSGVDLSRSAVMAVTLPSVFLILTFVIIAQAFCSPCKPR